ncbi:phage tail protein [Enterococcus faecalis]|uniref:phage tail protein n=1 Tax=Enterococcus faecalis TaxID=1351 RepID=UPI00312C6315|nr:phage tail protein [Enterococcus faecalis]
MDRYTPNFVWKGANALLDYGLIIESELPEIVAKPRYNEITVVGSNRVLNEWFGDYEPFDLKIKDVSVSYERLPEVKRWLSGQSELITHNNVNVYVNAVCNINNEVEYVNEWGTFYSFEITFRCEPLKRKVNEPFINLNKGENTVINHGDEVSQPLIEIHSNGGDISITCGKNTLTLINTSAGMLSVDNELAVCMQGGRIQRTKGNWIKMPPGKNKIMVTGNIASIRMKIRSVFF